MPSFKKRFQDCAGRLTTRITVVFGLLLGILISLFISSIVQIQKETEQTVRDAIANTLNIYEADYEAQLDTAQLMMSEIYGQMDNLRNLGADDQRASYFARYELTTDMEEKVTVNSPIDCIAVYYDGGLLRQYSNRVSNAEQIRLWDYLRENETFFTRYMSSSRENWRLAKIEEDYYLLSIYRTSGCTILTLLRVDTIFGTLLYYEDSQGRYALVSAEGNLVLHSPGEAASGLFPFIRTNEGKYEADYLIVTRTLPGSSLRLVFYEQRDRLLTGMSALQVTIYVILAVAVLGVVSILFFTRSQVLRPLSDMLAGVGEVEKGNLRHQIPTEGRPQEFQTLAEEFNKMSGEVLALRIDQYEQKLRLTESKLRYLQMQIRPHFYLNALTTIHSMSLQDRGEDIRQYIDMLSVHIRYMLYGDMAMTTVGKELEHVQNFVQMKELCFPGCVFYMDDVASPELLDTPMPKLMLLTSVENSFKYALKLYEIMNLLIKVDRWEENGQAFVRLIVEDDGDGYPEEMLRGFEQFTGSSGGVGIQNVRDTFRLRYGQPGLVRIKKAVPHGARTVLLIPTDEKRNGNGG